MFDFVSILSLDHNWLLTANLLLSTLLLLWVLRYKMQYRTSSRKAEQHMNSLNELDEGFYRSDLDGKLTFANPALTKMMGFETESEFLKYANSDQCYWRDDEQRRRQFIQLLNENSSLHDMVSKVVIPNTGDTIWVSEHAHVVQDAKGAPLQFEGSVQNVTDAIQHKALEDRIEKLSNNLPGGLFQLCRSKDGKFTVPYISSGFLEVMGVDRGFAIDPYQYIEQVHADHRDRYLQTLKQSFQHLSEWHVEFRFKKLDGTECWMGVIGTPELLENGDTIMHGHVNDISERKEAEGKIAYYAYYDPLTRLPNRTFFMHQLTQAISSSSRSGKFGAILFLDIDNFKLLNDTYGHAVGDMLLQDVAKLLSTTIRGNDIVSRFGGDEFVLLLDALGETEIEAAMNASVVARKIISEFSKGFNLSGIQQNSSPSIGIVTYDGENGDSDNLVKNADIAMYEAKKQGRNNFVVFDSDKSAIVTNLNQLQSRLSKAIGNDELTVYYQPQIDQNGMIYGAEALVRWQHPELGLLMPNDFIPLAEQSGLICELNDYVLYKSMNHLANWRKINSGSQLRLAVNISPQQLRQPTFVNGIQEIAGRLKLPLSLITLEVTEHTMARDFETMTLRMQEIRQLGVKISLDDFGTGYSSLSQLNELPFDEVKIDGSFIANLEESKASQSLVEAIIAMARALELEIVGEHVNTGFQERFLLARGCHKFQGYSYSKPLPESEFVALIKDRKPIQISG